MLLPFYAWFSLERTLALSILFIFFIDTFSLHHFRQNKTRKIDTMNSKRTMSWAHENGVRVTTVIGILAQKHFGKQNHRKCIWLNFPFRSWYWTFVTSFICSLWTMWKNDTTKGKTNDVQMIELICYAHVRIYSGMASCAFVSLCGRNESSNDVWWWWR